VIYSSGDLKVCLELARIVNSGYLLRLTTLQDVLAFMQSRREFQNQVTLNPFQLLLPVVRLNDVHEVGQIYPHIRTALDIPHRG
jgi:hypothetical protein